MKRIENNAGSSRTCLLATDANDSLIFSLKFSKPSVHDEFQDSDNIDLPQPLKHLILSYELTVDSLSCIFDIIVRGEMEPVRPKDPKYEFGAECTRLDPRC